MLTYGVLADSVTFGNFKFVCSLSQSVEYIGVQERITYQNLLLGVVKIKFYITSSFTIRSYELDGIIAI